MEFEAKEEVYGKGKKALEYGHLEEAEGFFQQILAEEPGEPHALNKMGVIWVYRKDKSKAREYFEQALESNPEHVGALCNLGSIELEEGNMNRAEMLYRQALRFDPKYGPAHNNLAYILKKTGRVTEGVKHMKQAQKAGAMSYDVSSKKTSRANSGCLIIVALSVIALILWYIAR